MRAAALTYTLLLSLVPLIAVCLAVLSLVVDIKKQTLDFKLFLADRAGIFDRQYLGEPTLFLARQIEQRLAVVATARREDE